MPKYRVEFEEIRRHTVEFETTEEIAIADGVPDDENDWFLELQNARPDWATWPAYYERSLELIERLDDDHEIV